MCVPTLGLHIGRLIRQNRRIQWLSNADLRRESGGIMSPDRNREPLEVTIVGTRSSWLERAVSYAALVISVLALLLSYKDEELQRTNQVLSVRPLLTAYSEFLDESAHPGLLIENRGAGPAVVKATDVTVGQDPYGSMTHGNWAKVLVASGLSDKIRTEYYSIETGFIVPTAKPVLLLGLADQLDPKNPEHRANATVLREFVKKSLKISICYCSLYDECWRLDYANDADGNDAPTTTPQVDCTTAVPSGTRAVRDPGS